MVIFRKFYSLTDKWIIACLITAHAVSRLSSVVTIATSCYVRDEGTGKPVAGSLSSSDMLVATITGFLVLIAWMVFLPASALLFALCGLAAGHVLMRLFFEKKLQGYTGDTLGAVQQSSEIGFYLGVCAWA